MLNVLLQPKLISIKRSIYAANSQRSRHLTLLIISASIMLLIYFSFSKLLDPTAPRSIDPQLFAKHLLSSTIHGACFLLLFSNFVAAIAVLFRSHESILLFSAPVSEIQKFNSKVCEVIAGSSWMILIFATPIIISYQQTFDLPFIFYLNALIASATLIVFCATLATAMAIPLLSLIPFAKLKNVLAIIGIMLTSFIIFSTQLTEQTPQSYELANEFEQSSILLLDQNMPKWLFSTYFATFFADTIFSESIEFTNLAKLFATAIFGYFLGLICFTKLYPKAWADSLTTTKSSTQRNSSLLFRKILKLIFPSQYLAIASKEVKTFFRDPTQSVQLLLLLVLTFLYLYNFRALRSTESLNETATTWWQALLAIINLALGSCVIAAITTRLVFPSVSLEGKCFETLKATPLTIHQLLYYKFATWIVPITTITLVLLLSGAWALFIPWEAVVATGFVALCFSISIVGLAIGIGGVYAEFDWHSPAQLTTNFGSLVFMFFSTLSIFFSLIPAAILLFFTIVPTLQEQVTQSTLLIILGSSATLCFVANFSIAKHSLAAAEKNLTRRYQH